MTVAAQVLAAGALACVGGAAVADVRAFEIPDGWSVAIAALYAATLLLGAPLPEVAAHLAAAVTVFAVGAWLFARGWFGGGDVKLISAVALWTGFARLPGFLMATFAAGAVLALAALAARRVAGRGGAASYPALRPDGPLPYAAAIFAGALADFGAGL